MTNDDSVRKGLAFIQICGAGVLGLSWGLVCQPGLGESWGAGFREREKQRERERQRDRETERQRDRETERERERQRDRARASAKAIARESERERQRSSTGGGHTRQITRKRHRRLHRCNTNGRGRPIRPRTS